MIVVKYKDRDTGKVDTITFASQALFDYWWALNTHCDVISIQG